MRLSVLKIALKEFEIEQKIQLFKPLKEIALKDDLNTMCKNIDEAFDFDDFTEKQVKLTDKLTRNSVDSAIFKLEKEELHFVEFKGFSNLQTGYSYEKRKKNELKFTEFIKEKFINFKIRNKIEDSIEKTLMPFISCHSLLDEESSPQGDISQLTHSHTFSIDYFVHFDCPMEDFEMFRLLTLDEVFNFKLPYLKSEPKLIFEYH